MARHNDTGSWGEQIARDYLVTQGYAIVQTNWRMHHLEVDILATKGRRMIFVEVKTRSDDAFDPLDAVDDRKRSRLVRAADVYLRSLDFPWEAQYDIVTIVGNPHDYRLEHIPDAFFPRVTTRR